MIPRSLAMAARSSWLGVWLACGTLSGCAGGTALNHPAHVLPAGAFSGGAGVSQHFALGNPARAIDRARSETAELRTIQAGALSLAAFAPGLSPWLGARAGIDGNSEFGVTYTGRAARADGRYALQGKMFALSIGGGVSAIAERRERTGLLATSGAEAIPDVEVGRIHGFGGDIPILFGARSDASLLQGWIGARTGVEHIAGDVTYQSGPNAVSGFTLSATRWYAGGLVGAAIGVHPFWVVLELDAAYQHVSGELQSGTGDYHPSLGGMTLTPSGALLARF